MANEMEIASHQTDDESVKDISANNIHHRYMREALNLVRHVSSWKIHHIHSTQAEQALRSNETPVGCVFVYDGRVIGRGMNDTNRSLNVGEFE